MFFHFAFKYFYQKFSKNQLVYILPEHTFLSSLVVKNRPSKHIHKTHYNHYWFLTFVPMDW